MHRFFVSPQSIQGDRAVIRGPVVHQIRNVLRMRPGDHVVLLDNTDWAYRTELFIIEPDVVRGRIVEKSKPETEPEARITLYQGLLKGQKFDWVLQKGTEIGVRAFVPVLSGRSVVGSLEDVSAVRVERWQRILIEAAEQAGRAHLPTLSEPVLFRHACESARRGGLAIIPWEGERNLGLRDALVGIPPSKEVHMLIGPEGGFAEEEIAMALEFGVLPVSLGPRILRAETAGLAAAAAILFHCGDFG